VASTFRFEEQLGGDVDQCRVAFSLSDTCTLRDDTAKLTQCVIADECR
jgi:hypothetical protein